MTITTDESALLARILAEPFEDAPRLVYADWLEENASSAPCGRCRGEGWLNTMRNDDWERCPECLGSGRVDDTRRARAELIRVQCELAALQADTAARKFDHHGGTSELRCRASRARFLRARERELWEKHSHRWFNDLTPLLRLVQIGDDHPDEMTVLNWSLRDRTGTVRRGFVEWVTVPLASWVGGPCGLCHHGRRDLGRRDPRDPIPNVARCWGCHGTGARPGIGVEVVRAAPVLCVEFAGKRPAIVEREPGFPGWTFYLSEVNDGPNHIRNCLWHKMGRTWYPTEAAANLALSRAAIDHARDLAGLPPVAWPDPGVS